MRLTGRSRSPGSRICRLIACLGLLVYSAFGADDTPHLALARLATALSQNDAPAALAVFDRSMKDYGTIEVSIQALTAQADILCAIEIIEQKGEVADTDWYLQMKPRGVGGESVRRRHRVSVTFRLEQGLWRIVAITPLIVLAPISIP